MPPLVKTPIQVVFGSADQKQQGKLLPAGKPSIAENVVQKETGSYSKRGGFSTITRTADVGSITVGKDLAISNGVPVMRTDSAVFALPGATWVNRGSYLPVSPSYAPLMPDRAAHPLRVVVGTQEWVFAQATDGTYYYQVIDSGIEVVAATQVSSTAVFWGRAVTTTGAVWLFSGPPSGGGNTIRAHKFSTASPSTAPTVTTFANPTGVSLDAFDVIDATANGNGIVMAVASVDVGGLDFGGGAAAVFYGRLNTTNGLVDGTGWVGDATVTLGQFRTPCNFIHAGQSATTLHFVFRRSTNAHVMLTAVTASTLVSATADQGAGTLLTASAATGLVGYRTSGGDIVVIMTDSSTGVESAVMTKATCSGGAIGAASTVARARFDTSAPFFVGTTPYIVAAHDDSAGLQRAYYLLDLSVTPARIVARAMYGLGGNGWQLGPVSLFTTEYFANWTCPVTVSGNMVSLAVNSTVSNTWAVQRLTFNLAPTDLGPPISGLDGQEILFPGGWPMALAGGGALSDLTPGMFPGSTWSVTEVLAGGGLAVGDYVASVCYVQVDRQGNLARSAPAASKTVTITAPNSAIRFNTVPTLRANNSNVQVFIEFYISAHDDLGLFLAGRVPNDPTVDSITTTAATDIRVEPSAGAEPLYTDGDALEHISAPPFKWAAQWRNRILLGGTDTPGAEVWPSFELTQAVGGAPAWNEDLRFKMPDGAGKDTAGCALDYNFFAIWKSDSAWVISGNGPDPTGNGSYGNTLQQVIDAPGCTNPRSVVQTPFGAVYQATNGEIWLITRTGTAQYIGDGWTDHEAATVVAAVHSPHYALVLLFLSTSVALVLDYGNALPAQGVTFQQYVWTLPAAPVAAVTSGSTLWWLDTTGVAHSYVPTSYRDGASTPILRRLRFPINLSGVRGNQRVYRGQVVGQFVDAFSFKATWTTFAGAAGETGATSQSWTRAVSSGPMLLEFRPDAGREVVAELTLEDTGTDLHEGASWDAVAFEVGVRSGLPRTNPGQKL